MGGKGGRKEEMGREKRGREGREGEWEHAPIGIFESRRLCNVVLRTDNGQNVKIQKFIEISVNY